MKETTETLTPEQHRAELLEEKAELHAQLTNIKVDIAAAVAANQREKIATLAAEKAEIVGMLADVDAELRQLKQELQHQTGLQDLHLMVQLTASLIASGMAGSVATDRAISVLNDIKEKLAAQ